MKPATRPRRLQALFLVSGAPGLMAQIAWTRLIGAHLGHEVPALFGVVSAFFAGLALGAGALDRRISASPRPASWYASLEIFSAVWILAGSFLVPALGDAALHLGGLDTSVVRRATIAFVASFLLVGPAAAAMGATLPAMDRAVTPFIPDGRAVSSLYALNTAGAVAGVLLAVAVVMPHVGLRGVLWSAACLQLFCGALAWWVSRESPSPPAPSHRDSTRPPTRSTPASASGVALSRRRLAWLAAVTGCLGIAFELLGVRALSRTTENTVQTFALILAIYLVGTALGAATFRALQRRDREPSPTLLLLGLAATGLAESWVLATSPRLLARFESLLPALLAEGILAAAVFLPPTLWMGALFGWIVQSARRDDGGVGRAIAWNTLGGALAGPLVGGWLLPWLGLGWTWIVVSLGYLPLLPGRPGTRRLAAVTLIVSLSFLAPRNLDLIDLPPGATIVSQAEGRLANVAVVRTADGHRTLRVNNHFQQGGTATAMAARRHTHLPLLLHPHPRRTLFLGLGTGVSFGAAIAHPDLRAVGVELLPEVIEALPRFEPENGAPQRHPAFRIIEADARRFVKLTDDTYDVVVADLYHPSEDGAGLLYTREHFAAIRRRLDPDGLFCQWLPLHQLDPRTFRDITRTFLEVFPQATLWLLRFNVDAPVVGLLGTLEPLTVDPVALATRCAANPSLAAALRTAALADPIRILGCRLADTASLRSWAADGSLATDDRPLVLFRASRAAYRPADHPPPHRRLLDCLDRFEPGFDTLLPAAGMEPWTTRLAAFRRARDLHLRGLSKDLEGRRRPAVEDFVASAEASADYTAGYGQAVLVASAYAREDPAFARDLLRRLVAARPEQRLAADLLRRLESGSPGDRSAEIGLNPDLPP